MGLRVVRRVRPGRDGEGAGIPLLNRDWVMEVGGWAIEKDGTSKSVVWTAWRRYSSNAVDSGSGHRN